MSLTMKQLGEARLNVARQAKTAEDWQRLWQPPRYPFAFEWGSCWKQCTEYIVDDFASELGFFTDILGIECNALGEDFAMLMGPKGEFYFAIRPSTAHQPSTPRDAISLQFMLDNIVEAASDLESRGIVFEKPVAPCEPGAPLRVGHFRTPHGIRVELWGVVQDKT